MKHSTFLFVAGGVVVAGAVAYGVYKYLQDHEDNSMEALEAEQPTDFEWFPKDANNQAGPVDRETPDFNSTKHESVSTVKERHQAASEAIEESLGKMKIDSAEQDEKLDRINNELDELLK